MEYFELITAESGLNKSTVSRVCSDIFIDLSTNDEQKGDKLFLFRNLIGKRRYISTRTRPDISLITDILACHVEDQAREHQKAASKVIKIMKVTRYLSFILRPGKGSQLSAYMDANLCEEPGSGGRLRPGIAIVYESALIFHRSLLQKCVTLSSSETEYVALSESVKTSVWLQLVLSELDGPQGATKV